MTEKIMSEDYRKSVELLDKADAAIRSLERGIYSAATPLTEIRRLAEERGNVGIEQIFYRHFHNI